MLNLDLKDIKGLQTFAILLFVGAVILPGYIFNYLFNPDFFYNCGVFLLSVISIGFSFLPFSLIAMCLFSVMASKDNIPEENENKMFSGIAIISEFVLLISYSIVFLIQLFNPIDLHMAVIILLSIISLLGLLFSIALHRANKKAPSK